MHLELKKRLFQRHPKALRYVIANRFPDGIPAIYLATIGIQCGSGWFDILDRQLSYWESFLNARASQETAENLWPFVISARRDDGELQLTILVWTPDGIGVMPSLWEDVDEQARQASSVTCECCGEPGHKFGNGHFAHVFCLACDAKAHPSRGRIRTWIDRHFDSVNSLMVTVSGISLVMVALLMTVALILWLCGIYPKPLVPLSEAQADAEQLKLLGLALGLFVTYLGAIVMGLLLAAKSLVQGFAANPDQLGNTP